MNAKLIQTAANWLTTHLATLKRSRMVLFGLLCNELCALFHGFFCAICDELWLVDLSCLRLAIPVQCNFEPYLVTDTKLANLFIRDECICCVNRMYFVALDETKLAHERGND